MSNEKIRAALKAGIAAERRKKRRLRAWRILITAMVILSITALAFPAIHAKYVSYLETLQPVGLDSITNTDLVEALYPVGSIYISTETINPGTVFGGTWQALPSGHCLVSEGGDYEALSTGGSPTAPDRINIGVSGTATGVGGAIPLLAGTATGVGKSQPLGASVTGVNGGPFTTSGSITLLPTNLPSHLHSIPSHTHTMPSHNHQYNYRGRANGYPSGSNDNNADAATHLYWKGYGNDNNSSTGDAIPNISGDASVANSDNSTGTGAPKSVTGSGTAVNLSGTATLTSASAGYSGAISVGGTASNLIGTVNGTVTAPDKTMQPYRVVHMWRRID